MGLTQPRELKSLEPGGLDYRRINQAIGEAAYARNEAAQLRYRNGRPGFDISVPVRMRVKAVYSTYLVCRIWDGATEVPIDYYVAKPPHLRWYPSAWPGMSIEGNAVTFTWAARANNIDGQRTAAQSGQTSQTEIIVPIWQWGTNDTGSGTGILGGYDEIWACEPIGGTGVITITETAWSGAAAPAPSGTIITLLDDNRNGRYWEQISA